MSPLGFTFTDQKGSTVRRAEPVAWLTLKVNTAFSQNELLKSRVCVILLRVTVKVKYQFVEGGVVIVPDHLGLLLGVL